MSIEALKETFAKNGLKEKTVHKKQLYFTINQNSDH